MEDVEIARKLKQMIGSTIQVEPAVVLSVDETKLTCRVRLLDDTEIPDVRLKAAIDELTQGMYQVPEVNSSVLVGKIGNNTKTRFVIMFSKVVKVVFYGGDNGGLLRWPACKTNEVLQAIVDSLKNFLPVAGDGGAALKTFFNTTLGTKTKGNFANLEDTKVLH
jgi:hypothetical protein